MDIFKEKYLLDTISGFHRFFEIESYTKSNVWDKSVNPESTQCFKKFQKTFIFQN